MCKLKDKGERKWKLISLIKINKQWVIKQNEKELLLQDVPAETIEEMVNRYQFKCKIGYKVKTCYVHKKSNNRIILRYV